MIPCPYRLRELSLGKASAILGGDGVCVGEDQFVSDRLLQSTFGEASTPSSFSFQLATTRRYLNHDRARGLHAPSPALHRALLFYLSKRWSHTNVSHVLVRRYRKGTRAIDTLAPRAPHFHTVI